MKTICYRILSLFMAVVIMVSLVPDMQIYVEASAIGDDYPYKGQSSGLDPWGFVKGNCTSFVAWRLESQNGFNLASNGMYGQALGHAKTWGINASNRGYRVDQIPAVGSVGYTTTGDFGHAVWVAEVNGDYVTVEEYNFDALNNGTKYRYWTRPVHKNTFAGYIHFKDLDNIPAPTGLRVRNPETNQEFATNDGTFQHFNVATGVPMTFSWNAVSGATQYEFELLRWENNSWVGQGIRHAPNPSFESYVWEGIWGFRVRASNGSWAEWTSFRAVVPPATPQGLRVRNPENNQEISTNDGTFQSFQVNAGTTLTFSWNAVANAPVYEVQLTHWNGSAWVLYGNPKNVFGTSTTYSIGATGGYGFQVRAGNWAVWSPWQGWFGFGVRPPTPNEDVMTLHEKGVIFHPDDWNVEVLRIEHLGALFANFAQLERRETDISATGMTIEQIIDIFHLLGLISEPQYWKNQSSINEILGFLFVALYERTDWSALIPINENVMTLHRKGIINHPNDWNFEILRVQHLGALFANFAHLEQRKTPISMTGITVEQIIDDFHGVGLISDSQYWKSQVSSGNISPFLFIALYERTNWDTFSSDTLRISVVESAGNYRIEICNPTDRAISCKGLYITDDNGDLFKWQMPAFIIRAGEFILISVIEDSLEPVLKRGRTNFDVALTERLLLVDAVGNVLSEWESQ